MRTTWCDDERRNMLLATRSTRATTSAATATVAESAFAAKRKHRRAARPLKEKVLLVCNMRKCHALYWAVFNFRFDFLYTSSSSSSSSSAALHNKWYSLFALQSLSNQKHLARQIWSYLHSLRLQTPQNHVTSALGSVDKNANWRRTIRNDHKYLLIAGQMQLPTSSLPFTRPKCHIAPHNGNDLCI